MEGREEVCGTSRRMKKITSYSIWFCTFSFGLAYNFLSPALIEITNKYQTTIDDTSKVFTIILLAYLVGAITCGILFNYLNRQLMVVGLLYVLAAGTLAMAHLPTKILFFVVGGIIGFACGGYDTSQVVWVLEMWSGEAGIWVQTQYFFFAVGNLIAPLLMRPFLMEENAQNGTMTTIGSCNEPQFNNSYSYYNEEESRLYIPLSIGGGIIVLAATNILMLFFYDKYEPPNESILQSSSDEDPTTTTMDEPPWRRRTLVALSAVCLGCYQGMEICTFQFVPTFTHYIDLELSEPDGALVLSGLTGAFALGRLFGIGASALQLKPALLLIANLDLTVTANILLLVFANDNINVLWAGAALLGLGYSTVFACIYDHIEKHIKVTNIVAAILVVAGGLVSAIYPLVVGDSVACNPFVLTYTIFFSIVSCTVSFVAIYWLTVVKVPNNNNS